MGKIQDKRNAMGYTQVEFAKMCAVTDRTVINWEARDEVLYLKDALRASDILEMPVRELCRKPRTPKES